MTDREMIQNQYERVKQEVDSWPESLRQIPNCQDLKIEMRHRERQRLERVREID